ncbi:protein O-glucosyltransferase 2 [Anabrus simplex]|uniref:protein O-glucosyltransferase 2 n=1 Tax=Anabrus simplex TaxID=316456 RepID=UPI0035A32382
MTMRLWILTLSAFMVEISHCKSKVEVSPLNTVVWGPGLTPDEIILPARYFYIHAVDTQGKKLEDSPGNGFTVHIVGESDVGNCRTWINILDRKDGSFIVRYKTYQTCFNVEIHVKYSGEHVASSPYKVAGDMYADTCYCPEKNFTKWLQKFNCRGSYSQIEDDLKPFNSVNFTAIRESVIKRFDNPGSMSICNYVIKDNQVYRKCYGRYVGFKMFMDAILLSLSRKVHLPDLEMVVNLGDWPLVPVNQKPIFPVFSWCGSEDSYDIVMPTYDITESSLENMGRVMVDMLSVQGNIGKRWNEKIEKAFWRGRDSRRERLQLVDIAREHPDLFNASLVNFFFFVDAEKTYGKEKYMSFFKFFDYKYQVNIDGTVAAYRVPYLLVGDSLLFKQDSKYYEFFYHQLEPWKHYIPFKSDLSNLVDLIKWAKENDDEARKISLNGQKFARENLMPHDIFCYHAVLFKEWSTRLVSEIQVLPDMEHVPQPAPSDSQKSCTCPRLMREEDADKTDAKDEL